MELQEERMVRATIPDDNEYHFAMAAKASSDSFQWRRTLEELRVVGVCRFRVFDNDAFEIGADFVDCVFQGRRTRVLKDELVRVNVDDGVLEIETAEQRWYRNSRICRIECGMISNPEQLLQLLHH